MCCLYSTPAGFWFLRSYFTSLVRIYFKDLYAFPWVQFITNIYSNIKSELSRLVKDFISPRIEQLLKLIFKISRFTFLFDRNVIGGEETVVS